MNVTGGGRTTVADSIAIAAKPRCTVVQSAPSRYGSIPGNGDGIIGSSPSRWRVRQHC
jgi:hypothetical protein